MDYLIIGGGLAGANAAVAIRENDKNGTIVIVTDENHIPYDRVPLSKNYLLGKMKREVLYVKKQDFYISEKIQVVSGRKATNLDPRNHTVTIDDGTEYVYKKLLF
ncbi:MAG: FAD-dependent oxidoreductase, partial [Thaumarchaeota archaeon]|nr:FAD-dependent oxidoreductase [Nitrososphaerota archaeon]